MGDEVFDVRILNLPSDPQASTPGQHRMQGTFFFHPDQITVKDKDGSLTVRFQGGRQLTRVLAPDHVGEGVTIAQPVRLRRHLANMCASLAAHHAD